MSVRLVVENLSPDTTSDELRDLLGDVEGVEWCHLITERDAGRSEAYAFVKMNSMEAAYLARERFNGRDLHGCEIRLQEIDPDDDGGYGGTRLL